MHMFGLTLWNLEIWWFGSAFIIFHHFSPSFKIFYPFDIASIWKVSHRFFVALRSRWLGDGCKLLAWQRLRSSMVSGARPLQRKQRFLGLLHTLVFVQMKAFQIIFIHWNYFEYLWLWHINMLEQCNVTIAGGTLWLQLQTLCGTTSPCNWDKWYSVFFASILRLHEYNTF